MVKSPNAPNLTKISGHAAGPRYTILGKRKIIDKTEDMPASNKYDCRGHVERTSKFRSVSQPCGFAKANRWGVPSKADNITAGPGMYDMAKSTLDKRDVGFAKAQRPGLEAQLGVRAGDICPGPGQYEVRDKNRKMESTLSQRTVKQLGRHGWFYDNKEDVLKPASNQYKINYSLTESEVSPGIKVGTSLRPPIESQIGVGSNETGPGQYKVMTTLGGNAVVANAPKYSFTTAGWIQPKRDVTNADFVLQCSTFGYPQAHKA